MRAHVPLWDMAVAADPVAAIEPGGRSNGRWGLGKEEKRRRCIIVICAH